MWYRPYPTEYFRQCCRNLRISYHHLHLGCIPYEIGRNYTPRRHLLRIVRICAKAQMLIHSAVPPLPHKIIFDAFPGTPLCEIAVLQTAR